MSALHPLLPVRRSARDIDHVPAVLSKSSHVFLRVDAVRRPLTPPYDGPFPVLVRGPKTFQILKNNKAVTVSIDRLKPAFIDNELTSPVPVVPPAHDTTADRPVDTAAVRSRSGRRIAPPDRLRL